MADEQEKLTVYDRINRLLSRKEPSKPADETVLGNFARSRRLADAAVTPETEMEKTRRIEPIEAQPEEKPDDGEKAPPPDIAISSRTAKQRVADVINGMKQSGAVCAGDFDEPLLPVKEHGMETDENRRRFLETVEPEEEETPAEEGTQVFERPGFMVKKVKTETIDDLESIPVIVEAEDVKTDEDLFTDETEEQEDPMSWTKRQMVLEGFGPAEKTETPEQVSEEEAEEKLHTRRKERAGRFHVIAEAENEGIDQAETDELRRLFNDPKPPKKEVKPYESRSRLGFEYMQEKDVGHIRTTLYTYRRQAMLRTTLYGVLCAALLMVNLISVFASGYDTGWVSVLNLLLLAVCIFAGREHINTGVLALFNKNPDMQSAVAAVTFAATVQTLCAAVANLALDYHTFSIAGCAAGAFALLEYSEYLRHARTLSALTFCTGKMRDRLYSVQRIEKELDAFEIGRNLLMGSPDIRYSCRAKRPARLIERCEGDVSADKLQSLLLPIAMIGALISGVLGGILTKDFLGGVTSAASAVCLCVPAFGAAAIQLPMRWANRRFNRDGGLLTGQSAIEEYSTANAVVIDSAALFDQENCQMHGFRDFHHVRIDDIMLYTAAMVIHSGGPLTQVFDQVISKRELLPEVSGFSYEDRMGISGWINGQKVFIGNRNMMRHHNFDVEHVNEEKYAHDGRKVIYVAIANSLAALLVVSYAPNRKILPFLKRLGVDGVTILLRNFDPNVTTDLINETFGMRLGNIRLMSSTSGKIYKKYRTRVREYAKSGIIHDGSALSLLRSFTMSYTLCGTFKIINLLMLFHVLLGVLVAGLLSALGVVTAVGMWPLLLFQAVMAAVAYLIARLRGIF